MGGEAASQKEELRAALRAGAERGDLPTFTKVADQLCDRAGLTYLKALTLDLGAVGAPLHAAAANGHLDLVAYLLSENCPVDQRNGTKETALHLAASENWPDLTHVLIASTANPAALDGGERTPLHRACQAGAGSTTEILLGYESGLALPDKSGLTPLHHAVYGQHLALAKTLLDAEVEVDQEIVGMGGMEELRLGWTPLHLACIRGSLKGVKLLLEHKASVHKRDECGQAPLHCAAVRDAEPVVKVLLEHQSDVHLQDESLWTPLHHAAEMGSVKAARLLLEAKAQITAKNGCNRTPLHLATDEGNLEMCSLLLQYGAPHDNLRAAYGQPTPRMIAARNGSGRVTTLFDMADLVVR
jgi:ankyrin repeat protein